MMIEDLEIEDMKRRLDAVDTMIDWRYPGQDLNQRDLVI